MRKQEAQVNRIAAIIGSDDDEWDVPQAQAASAFYEHLRKNLQLPCQVTGIEDFRWEEPYVIGGWDRNEYEELKKTQPSYKDRYDLLEITAEGYSEWMLFFEEDIAARVRRISDGKEFILGLAELKATDKKSQNHQLLHDYAVWLVNSR